MSSNAQFVLSRRAFPRASGAVYASGTINSAAENPVLGRAPCAPRQLHPRKLTPLAAAILAALYPVVPAMAQDSRIEEIIVTATKREMNMQDLGQSITALTTDRKSVV